MIAATLGLNRDIIIPKLDPARELIELSSIAERYCALMGYQAVLYEDEKDAVASTLHEKRKVAGQY